MKQILLAYDIPKEIITAIMMLYSNTKAKIHSPDGDTPQKCSCTATYLPFIKQSKKDKQDMGDTVGEARTNS